MVFSMKGQTIPSEHHIVRYIPWSKLRKDENDDVLGVLGVAFQPRLGEKALSATWLEYFPGEREVQITAVVHAVRASDLKPGAKSGFAIGKVVVITAACANRGHKVRIVHEPRVDNKAHVGVRRMPRDDAELLEILAAEEWAELVLNSEIPAGSAPAP
jgi:hypothetical protein